MGIPGKQEPERTLDGFRGWAGFALALAAWAGVRAGPAAAAGWAERTEFSETAVVVGFDDLQPGQEVAGQYRLQGVTLSAGGGRPLTVQDAGQAGPGAVSEPHVAVAEAGNTVVLRFEHGVERVGVYVLGLGALGPNDAVLLRTYDEAGQGVYTAVYTPPPGDPYPPTLSSGFEVTAPPGSVAAAFIGVQADKPVIRRAELEMQLAQPADAAPRVVPLVIDDVVFEPGPPDDAAADLAAALGSANADPEQQIAAIEAALIRPGPAAAQALRDAVGNPDLDPYVRERAALALIDLADPRAIPVLARVGQGTSDPYLRMAAHQAVWALRKAFPMSDPPEIEVVPPQDPVSPDRPFDLAAKITWPVARKSVQARLVAGKGLSLRSGSGQTAFSGSVDQGQTLVLTGSFRSQPVWAPGPDGDREIRPEQAEIEVVVRVNNGPVDIATYRVPVYVDFGQGTVSAAEPQVQEPSDHVIGGGEQP